MNRKDLQKYLMAQGISEARAKKIVPQILKISHELEEAEVDERLAESANTGNWLEARLHLGFTEIADGMFGEGRITREERIALSSAIGDALDAFRAKVEANAPQLYQRSPWDEAPAPGTGNAVAESAPGAGGEVELMESAMYMPLMEKAVRRDGTIPIKIIQPGWGSSGYYPAEVLERDGPRIFAKGTKMYWNHQTPTEEAERPEGDLNALAAELVSEATYQANGPAGAGLYANAKVFEAYQNPVDDLAPHIGVSIRAYGKAQNGQVEGRQGPIITELTASKSIDFVTEPGAGGQILTMFEAARNYPAVQNATTESVDNPNSLKEARMEELQKLQEANATLQTKLSEAEAKLARANEALALLEAQKLVAKALTKFELPEATRARLLESLPKAAPMKDGAVDQEAFEARIAEAVQAEVEYLTKATGLGNIRGLGESQGEPQGVDDAKVKEALAGAFADLGLTENSAKIAAHGRG